MLNRQQVPNLLTFARVLAVPVCLGIMLSNPTWKAQALLWIFIAASLTDFLDGYLARRWQVISALGTMLDPVADKLLVALMLLYLLMEAGAMLPLFLPVTVILLRELYISGLRAFLSARQITLPVSKSGKWKTALQMIAITLLLTQLAHEIAHLPLYCFAPFTAAFSDACGASPTAIASIAATLGAPLLYASALLAFTSAVSYTRASLKHLR